jgi:hypothetical protein
LRVDVGELRGIEGQAREIGRAGRAGRSAAAPTYRASAMRARFDWAAASVARLRRSISAPCMPEEVSLRRPPGADARSAVATASAASSIWRAIRRSTSAAYQRASHAVAVSRMTASRVDSSVTHAALRVVFGALRTQPALFLAREFLHHADLRHRHEVARKRPAVGSVGRHVFYADLQLGIRQLAGGTAISQAASTIARCDSSCGDRSTASRSVSANDSGGSAANAGAISSDAIAATAIRAICEQAAAAAPSSADDDGMNPPRTR